MNNKYGIHPEDYKELTEKYKTKKLEKYIKKGYPIQYLLNRVNFYGYDFNVNKNVLIPRFETETLIEKTIKYIKELNLETDNLLDIGTGSGAIAITLKKELPHLNISAIDISNKALKIAKENAQKNNANINFVRADIFRYVIKEKYGVIISNPPYIEKESNYNKNVLYEPKKAIFVKKNNPLIYYEEILKKSVTALTKKSLICFEIDEDHGKDMIELSKKYYPKSKVLLEQDLANKDRYIFIINE